MMTRSILNRQSPLVIRALRLHENEKSSGMKKKKVTHAQIQQECALQRTQKDED